MKKTIPLLIAACFATTARPDSIQLKNGTELHGELIEKQAGFVLLRLPETNGEAFRRIDPETITALLFEDPPETSLELRALRRSQFISHLSPSDAHLLTDFLQTSLAAAQASTTLAYAKLWHPKNTYSELDTPYRQLLIRAALQSKRPDEALFHAQTWLAQQPTPLDQPLPWQILAQHQLESDHPEAALWTVLQPIAHATSQNPNDLAPLHTIAAQAYEKLGYTNHAQAHRTDAPLPLPNAPFPPLPSLLADTLTFSQLLKTKSTQ